MDNQTKDDSPSQTTPSTKKEPTSVQETRGSNITRQQQQGRRHAEERRDEDRQSIQTAKWRWSQRGSQANTTTSAALAAATAAATSTETSTSSPTIQNNNTANIVEQGLPTAQLADAQELRRQALAETVVARAELVSDDSHRLEDQEPQTHDESPSNKNKRLLWWGLAIGVVIVIGVVAGVVVSASGGSDDDSLDDKTNTDMPTLSPSPVPATPIPTAMPSSRAPTTLIWEASATLRGSFEDDDTVLGDQGQFGHDVAVTAFSNDDDLITVLATFGQAQRFDGVQRQYQYATFSCNRMGQCDQGTPVEAALPITDVTDTFQWNLAFAQDNSLAVAAQGSLFWGNCQLENSQDTQHVDTNKRGDLIAGLGSNGAVAYDISSLKEDGCPSLLLDAREQQEVLRGAALAVDGRRVAAGFNVENATADTFQSCSPCQPEGLFFQGYRVQILDSDNGEEAVIDQGEGWSLVGDDSLSMAANGSLLAVGSSFEEIPRGVAFATRQDVGQVQVWQLNQDAEGSTWLPFGPAIVSPVRGDRFGASVVLSSDGSVMAVAAPEDRTNGLGSGRVTVYRWMNDSWEIEEEFLGFTGSSFGLSLAMTPDGTQLVVGGPDSPRFGPGTGEVQLLSLVAV